MFGFLQSLGAWNWLILGIVLLCAELALPGVFMLWFGLAALAVGALSLLLDWGWQAQIVAFGLLSVAAVGVSRLLSRSRADEGDTPFLNERAEGLVGRSFVLAEPIVGGWGRIAVDDTMWRVSGPDMPAGTRVTVERAEGARLVVRSAGA